MPNPIDKMFRLDALLSQKVQQVEEASEAKKMEMDPGLALVKEYWARYDADAQRRLAESGRTTFEKTDDFGISAIRGTTGLLGGTAALALDLGEKIGPSGLITDQIEEGTFGENARESLELSRGIRRGVVEGTNRVDQLLAERLSRTSQVNEQIVAAENAADAAVHAAEYDAAIAAGDNETVAGAKRLLKDIGSGAGNTLSNPVAAGNMIAGQVPTLGIGLGARAAVSAEAIAARAALLAERKGMTMAAATAQATKDLATRNLMVGVGGMEAGGAYAQGAGAVLEADLDTLAAQYPELAGQLLDPATAESARDALASKVGLTAAAIQGPLAALTSRIAARFELNPLGIGDDAVGTLAQGQRLVANAAQEGLEETIQSGSGELSVNLAQRAAGNEQVDLLDGVGIAAGQGGAVGAGMAGVLQTPAVAVEGVKDVGKLLLKGGRAALRKAIERGDAIAADMEAPSREQEARVQEQLRTQSAQVASTLQTLVPEAASATPASADPLLDDTDKASLGLIDEPSLDRVQTMARALNTLAAPETPAERHGNLQLFVLKTARELGQTYETALAKAESAPADSEEQQTYANLAQQIHGLIHSPVVTQLEAAVAQAPAEQVQALIDALPETVVEAGDAQAPEVARVIEQLKQRAYVAPDTIPAVSPAKAKALFQSTQLSEADKNQLQLAFDFSSIQTAYNTARDALKSAYPKFKARDVVSEEIHESGFSLGNKELKSVADHVRTVATAMAAGRTQEAKLAMQDFGKFAAHMAQKASMFDATAMRQLDLPEDQQDTWTPVTGSKRLAGDGKLGREHEVNLKVEGSRANIDAIFADANAVVAAHNLLLSKFPTLGQLSGKAPLSVAAEPQWKSYTPQPKVEDAPAAADVAPPAPVQDAGAEPAEVVSAVPAAVPAEPEAREAVAPDETAPAEQQRTDEGAGDHAVELPALAVDFGSTERASDAELDEALALSDEQYLAVVNPEGKVTDVASDEAIDAELEDTEPSSRAVTVGQVGEIELKADGDYLYAMDGDNTVGLLVHKDGSTFMVHSDYRGRGLGKAMMRELLVRKPMAGSNGLSAAAQATRLAVLRDLRAERAPAPAPKTMAERFPSLPAQLGEPDASLAPAEQYARKNKFLHAFQLAKDAMGLFARLPQGLRTVTALLDTPEALYPEGLQYLAPLDEELPAYQKLFGQIVPNVVQALNENLNARATGHDLEGNKKGSGFLSRLLDPSKGEWNFANRLSLNAVEVRQDGNQTTLQYAPEIADAMATAGMHWLLRLRQMPVQYNFEKLSKTYGKRLTPEILQTAQLAHFYEQPVNDLARDIIEILGLKANNAASVTLTHGIAVALAQDVIQTFNKAGLIDLRIEALAPNEQGKDDRTSVTFLSFDERPNDVKEDLAVLDELMGPLESLTQMLYPGRVDLGTTGAAPKQLNRKVSGTHQDLSVAQTEAVRKRQNTPHFLNEAYLGLLDALGRDNYLKLRASDGEGDQVLNEMHRVSIKGKHDAAVRNWNMLQSLRTTMERYGRANNLALRDVPQFFSARMIKNGRIMLDGNFNPVAHKLARETITPVRVTLNLRNDKDKRQLRIAIAQALGFKVEREIHDDLLQKLDVALRERFAKATDLIQQIMQDPENVPDLAQQLTSELLQQFKGEVSDRTLHALFAHAMAQQLEGTELETEFETSLPLEHDGVTDGPINSMVQLGLYALDEKMIAQLRQGGVFVGNHDKPTLNAHGYEIGDLYRNAAGYLKRTLVQVMGQTNVDGKMQDRSFAASVYLLTAIDYVRLPENSEDLEDIEVTRDPGKATLMPMNYGSGDKSLMRVIVDKLANHVYQEMSAAHARNEPLDAGLRGSLAQLIGSDSLARRLADPGQYLTFRFSEGDLEILADSMMEQAGGALLEGVRAEMDPVLDSFGKLYQMSAARSFLHRKAFEAAYAAKHAERVAAGELGPKEALSREDEREILAGLRDKAPIVQLMGTAGEGNNVGLDITKANRQGRFVVDGEEQRIRPLLGGQLPMHVPAYVIENPGVRVAAMATVALGDGTMMTQIEGNRPEGTIQVYDGWETPPGSLEERGLEINQAVVKGYQYHGMQALVAGLTVDMAEIAALSSDELNQLGRAMRIRPMKGEPQAGYLQRIQAELAGNQLVMASRAELNGKIQDVLFGEGTGVQVAVDHMASAMAPALIGGQAISGSDADVAAEVLRRANASLPAPVAQDETLPATPLAKRLGLRSDNDMAAVPNLRELDATDVQLLLETFTFKSKLQQFVVSQIKHLLPEDLRVFAGTPAAIADKQQELFPGVALGGESEVGAYIDNTIFLKTTAEETFAHELVHAATYHLVRRFYQGAKGLTGVQRDAVRSLEVLARDFATQEAANDGMHLAQRTVRNLFGDGHVAEAVNEFMAWTLTNREVAAAMHQRAGNPTLKKLAKTVLGFVRKLLGLPNNQPMESFLEQTLGQFHRLVRREAPVGSLAGDTMALFMAMGDGSVATTPHGSHVEDVIRTVERIINGIPQFPIDSPQADAMHKAFVQSVELQDQFVEAGFNFAPREKLAFQLVQALLASALEFDPIAMNELQDLHTAAMRQLTVEDFLDVPADQADEAARSEAGNRFNALLNVRAEDTQGRTNLLANFVALGLVHEPLRNKLSTLTVPGEKLDRSTIDGFLRTAANKVLGTLTDKALHINAHDSQRRILDLLFTRLAETQEKAAAQLKSRESYLAQGENLIKQGMVRAASWLEGVQQPYLSKTDISTTDAWINGLLGMGRGLLTAEGATAFAEGALTVLNTSKLPKFFRELGAELIGMTDSNAAVFLLLNRSKHMVARVRQRLRDEGPGMVRDLFSRELPDATWTTLYRAAGRTDLQALLGSYSSEQLIAMLGDPAAMGEAVAALEARLEGNHQAAWLEGADHLATWMVERKNQAPLLARNASALARLAGREVAVAPEVAKRAAPFLDRLVSLYALQKLGDGERALLVDLLRNERAGMEGLLKLLRTLVRNEQGKPDAAAQKFNAWKGYVPASLDPRNDLVLAGGSKGKELLKQGYRLVGYYFGDLDDPASGLAYYSTSREGRFDLRSGGRSTYNQGAMQTVEGTVAGVDRVVGTTLDAAVKTLIDHPATVEAITKRKQQGSAAGDRNLLPVFDAEGKVRAYERVLDQAVMDQHLVEHRDLSKAIGSWLGRQAEETLARGFNTQLVSVLKQQWDDAVLQNKEGEFVDISHATDPIGKDVWGSIPRETQREMKSLFGSAVMVRKDMVNNALGYRSASVADVFTGVSALPENARQGLEKAMLGMPGLGKDAYRRLVALERTWQGLIGAAKDWIVVRSGVVALANGVANQFQLLQNGVPITRLLQTQARKIEETRVYLRNERRLAQITVELASKTRPDERRPLENEGRLLRDANQRLSIWPLIEAGELPSISEGLSEQDEYTILADITGWLEQRMEKLPKGLSTAAKYAVIAKDTALYQGLNRMIQFGDFMAKATLYDHLRSTGKTSEQALRQVSETFVNYNLLPGRGRDYLESMGLTWFMNYKLRIQKILLRTLRENPLSFLLAGAGAEWLGADSLVSSNPLSANWDYALGPGQFWRADDMLAWRQLFD